MENTAVKSETGTNSIGKQVPTQSGGNRYQAKAETGTNSIGKLSQIQSGKCPHRYFLLCAGAFLLVLGVCCFSFAQEPEQKVRGFSLVQYEDNGAEKWELNGRLAEIEVNEVKMREISVLTFEKGMVVKLKAREGNFDRVKQLVHLEDNVVLKTADGIRLGTDSLDWYVKEKKVVSDKPVYIKRADFDIEGIAVVCDLENKTAELREDVIAKIRGTPVRRSPPEADEGGRDEGRGTKDEGRLFGEVRLGWTERITDEITVTCDGPLQIDYIKNKATFQNNVKIVDTKGDVFSDRMDIYFDQGTNRMKCAVVRGNVRIMNEESVTYSQKAIYLVDRHRLVLPRRTKLLIGAQYE